MVKLEEMLGGFMFEDLKYIAASDVGFDKLKGKTVLVVGAADTVGRFVSLSLLLRNDLYLDGIRVISVGCSLQQCGRDDLLIFDNFFDGYEAISKEALDFIVYLTPSDASVFKALPGSTLERQRMLVSSVMALAVKKKARVLFVSPLEVYGAVHNGYKPIRESDVGYISPNSSENPVGLAARFGETFTSSFAKEREVSVTFARLPIIYGDPDSTNKINRLLFSAVQGKAVLPQLPDEKMSVAYITDCVRAVLFLLLNGKECEAYNAAFDRTVVTYRDMLNTTDKLCGREPSFGKAEESSYMTPCRILDGTKLSQLGFDSSLTLEQGLRGTFMKFNKTRSGLSE